MKIVLAAVMHSPNLGDGLIADCLSEQFRHQDSRVEIRWLDLAGRGTFAAPSKGARTFLLSLLTRLPQGLSQALAKQLVKRQIRTSLEPMIPDSFQDADAVVIGGGQLLGDANLNFPLKIARVVQEAEKRSLPIAIHSVGVAKSWSPRGRQLFSALLGSPNLRFVSVRDQGSADNLRHHYKSLGIDLPEVHIFPDPALTASELALPQAPEAAVGAIGVGIAHPAAINTHADQDTLSFKQSLSQYQAILTELQQRNENTALFTNGAGEDEEMLDALWQSLPSRQGISRLPRPETPRDLVAAIKAMDLVVSHRLHACITAHAVGTPAIGFRWDSKVDGYFSLVGETENLLRFSEKPERIADHAVRLKQARNTADIEQQIPVIQIGAHQLLSSLAASGSSVAS